MIQGLNPFEAFGAAGSYERNMLARLYQYWSRYCGWHVEKLVSRVSERRMRRAKRTLGNQFRNAVIIVRSRIPFDQYAHRLTDYLGILEYLREGSLVHHPRSASLPLSLWPGVEEVGSLLPGASDGSFTPSMNCIHSNSYSPRGVKI